jgi:hypothetical protein
MSVVSRGEHEREGRTGLVATPASHHRHEEGSLVGAWGLGVVFVRLGTDYEGELEGLQEGCDNNISVRSVEGPGLLQSSQPFAFYFWLCTLSYPAVQTIP